MSHEAHRIIEVLADVDERHRLCVELPKYVHPGPVRVLVFLPPQEGGARWTEAVARAWADELEDARQDLYTLEDGTPVEVPR